jgi:hypothetical protein
MKHNTDELFDQLLEEMQKGMTVDQCLAMYPEYADELKPLLEIVRSIADLSVPEPREQAVAETLRQVRVHNRKEEHRKPFLLRPFIPWQPALVRAAAIVILIIAIGWTTASLSARSLPGEPLYSVKRLTERIEYSVAFNAYQKAVLHLRFADRRTQEFSYTFTPGEKIDRALLSAMLNEVQFAFQYAGKCSENRCAVLMQRVADYNSLQLHVLETTRSRACDCDREVLGRAISVCQDRFACLGCVENDGTLPDASSPCWNNECHFR